MSDFFAGENRSALLLDGMWGLEREAQRVTAAGDLALTDHPAVFGDKLTNPVITTDFAESQLEMITPPHRLIEETYKSLQIIQAQAEQGIGPELLWPLSMPPRLPAERDIPMAKFGNSKEGREKEVYRRGLALRYGKKMQLISGLHYNFSFGREMRDELRRYFGMGSEEQDFRNELYFAVARNFLRYRWLLIYLYGASPSVDATYYSVICRELEFIAQCCPEYCSILEEYQLYATSLRVSRFGYSNPVSGKTPGHDAIYFNSLTNYLRNLRRLLSTRSQEFMRHGIFQNGTQIQLNDNILQKESEFYAAVRFKQTPHSGVTQLDLLEREGVKYLEVRILDANPFESTGISLSQLYFLQVFMLYCLFENSPSFSEAEFEQCNKNHHAVALFGRNPGLILDRFANDAISLRIWSQAIFDKLRTIAVLLDRGSKNQKYQYSVAEEYQKVLDPALLPSARIEREMAMNRESFLAFGVRRAILNKQTQMMGNREVG